MAYRLGRRSTFNLCKSGDKGLGCHPDIQKATLLAIQRSKQDFCIIDNGGARSTMVARANAAKGVGVSNSLHIPQSDGYAHAVDLVAFYNGKPSWQRELYLPIREAMLSACDDIGLLIQHGADWDLDSILGEKGEWDWPHWQKPRRQDRIRHAALALAGRLV